MSIDKLRELKLYRKLQKNIILQQKHQQKARQLSNHIPSIRQSSNGSCKINKNRKYFLEEQKNAEIEKENRRLFQKIQAHGTRRYYIQDGTRNRSSNKTLNTIEDSDNLSKGSHSQKHKNYSLSKIKSTQQQSRISFLESQQSMRPKQNRTRRMLTQASPEIINLLRSRISQRRTIDYQRAQEAQTQTVLFQGVAEIDTIKFKTKIFIKDGIYHLMGKNKHTQIILRMEINQYKKFHKQVLKGNPSNIFNYLKIEKGQIRFRTRKQEVDDDINNIKKQGNNKKKIYLIEEQDEDQDYNNNGQQVDSSYPKGPQRSMINKDILTKNQRKYHHRLVVDQNTNKKVKDHSSFEQNELQNQIIQKINKHNSQKNTYDGQNVEPQQKLMKNRYRLPCI